MQDIHNSVQRKPHLRCILRLNTADIIIAAGGGAGTLSEIAFAWQRNRRVLCVTTFGGWAAELASEDLDKRAKDLLIPVTNIEEIRILLSKYLSI